MAEAGLLQTDFGNLEFGDAPAGFLPTAYVFIKPLNNAAPAQLE